MRYWDSSALVPLVVREQLSPRSSGLLASDPKVGTWWLSRVECASALNRLRRDGLLDESGLRNALQALEVLVRSCVEVQPSPQLRESAIRLLRVHPLRVADAMQLAAALIIAGTYRGSLELVSFDSRLLEAADREGLAVLGADQGPAGRRHAAD